MRRWKLVVLLVLAVFAAGCSGWVDDSPRPGSIYGHARVDVGGTTFPLAGVRVVTSGATNVVTRTQRDGRFTLSRLREGMHTVRLQALHGTYTDSLYVQEREELPWTVKPTNISPELFFQVSTLKQVYADASDRIVWDYGELVRWEKKLISVYMDVAGAPFGLDPAVPDAYWKELDRWESYLAYNYRFVRAHDPERADIVVQWVPPQWLWPEVGIARQKAFYSNGALRRVEIEIDVEWADVPGLWEHELAHAMGIGHINDSKSVMYPFLAPGQRTTLSDVEVAHVRLMYDIPSGQRLVGGWGARVASLAAVETEFEDDIMLISDEDWSTPGDIVPTSGSGTRTHVLRVAPGLEP